jgi:hypothetical protein
MAINNPNYTRIKAEKVLEEMPEGPDKLAIQIYIEQLKERCDIIRKKNDEYKNFFKQLKDFLPKKYYE